MADNSAIVYKFETLEECSQQLGRLSGNISDIYARMTELSDSLGSEWSGEAQQAYSERSERIMKFLNTIDKEMKQRKKDLDGAINIMRHTEITQKSNVDSLSDKDIF